MPAQPRNVFTSPGAGRKLSKAPAGFLPSQASRPPPQGGRIVLGSSSSGHILGSFCLTLSLHRYKPDSVGLEPGPSPDPSSVSKRGGTLTSPLPSLASASPFY